MVNPGVDAYTETPN